MAFVRQVTASSDQVGTGQPADNEKGGAEHVNTKRGRRRSGLRGDYAEARELAGVLRDIADSRGLTLRDLEERMPYARTSISARLSGESRPEWKFVTSFLAACTSGDRQAAAVLENKVRLLWEAAAPNRAHEVATVPPVQVPADIGAWVTAMREAAAAQQVVARLQLLASRNMGTVQGLLLMTVKLASAAQALTEERDALRRELLAHSDTASELLRTRALLDDAQRRLEAAERLLAQTSRRLDEALRQREEAERLRRVAIGQTQEARKRLAQMERHAIAFADSVRAEVQPGGEATLMDGTDQLLAAEILRRADDTLSAEASALDQLQGELASTSTDNGGLSGGQTPAAGSARRAGRSAVPLLQRLAQRQIDQAASLVRQVPRGGEIAYDGEDRDWLLDLTREAEHSMDAISLSTVDGEMRGVDDGFWTSDLGARYLQLQREAITRHVRIRRIFVAENASLARNQEFLKITQMQREAGVDVKQLDHELIPKWMQSMIFDFIIFDGAVSYETTPATTFTDGQTRPTIVRTVLSTVPARVRELGNCFDQLWAAAFTDHKKS